MGNKGVKGGRRRGGRERGSRGRERKVETVSSFHLLSLVSSPSPLRSLEVRILLLSPVSQYKRQVRTLSSHVHATNLTCIAVQQCLSRNIPSPYHEKSHLQQTYKQK